MKEAYYFSHDSNAKDDPKCLRLINDLGVKGYGIYWILIEILRDQNGFKYPLDLIPILAKRYNVDVDEMTNVIKKYNLFAIDKENFYSKSLVGRMQEKLERSKKNSKAALKMWENKKKTL